MFGRHDTAYGSQHNVEGSSSQHNVGGSLSQQTVGDFFIFSTRLWTYSSGANDVDYLQKAQTEYQVDREEVSKFITQGDDNKRKRYKSSHNSSFNTRDSGEGNFNLNNTTRDEEDEVHEVRPSRPMGRDQAKSKGKRRHRRHLQQLALMVNEYATTNDPYNV
ncbi:hypothetical protein Tco_1201423 [Tanacetum coccineum]